MKITGRRAVFLCLCFWACLLMNSFFPASEAKHDCVGENCQICAQAEVSRSSGGNAAPPSNAVFSRLFAVNVRRSASEIDDGRRRLSPAELMVKLIC
ncbi:MAG: hypothetical protein LBE65_02330 [Synergistaceae bacterium]|nr:hypothetical protein [Synergistaceae bacterium]